MKHTPSIPPTQMWRVAVCGLLAAGFLSLMAPRFIAHAVAPPPQASFDHTITLSFKANPTITGTAAGLVSPLHVSITTLNSSEEVFARDLATTSGSWSMVVYPPVAVGLYHITLSSGGEVLDQGFLAIGASRPTLKLDTSLGSWDVADGHLLRFSIKANQDPISVAQLAFTVAPVNATIDTLTLYDFTDSAYTQPVASSTDGTLATTTLDATSSIAIFSLDPPLTIPSGQTYYFTLDGGVTPIDGTYSITTSIPSDAPMDMAGTVEDLASTSNFIWSPNSFGTSSPTDADWMNGSALPELFFGLTQERYSAPVLACDLEADNDTIAAATPVTLTWTSSGASRAIWDSGAAAPVQGSQTITVSSTHTYTLTFSGSLGSMQCATTILFQPNSSASSTTAGSSSPSNTQNASSLGNFTTTPTSGSAPLSVTFKGSVNNTKSCLAATYALAYGDNSTSTISVPAKSCKPQPFSFNHTYNNAGTYTAALYTGTVVKGNLASSTRIQIQQIAVASHVGMAGTSLIANVFSAAWNWLGWLGKYIGRLR